MDRLSKEREELLQFADELKEEGVQKLREGKLKEAEITMRRASVLYEKIQKYYDKAASLNLLSIIYDDMGNDSMCLECMLDAMELAQKIKAYDMAAKVLNNLGSKFLNLKSYHRALYYFDQAKDMFDRAVRKDPQAEKSNPYFVLILNLNMSSTYCYMNELSKAKTFYLVAKEKANCIERQELLFTFKTYEGLILWRLGDKELSISLVDDIMKSAEETEYTTDYLAVMADLIVLLKEMGDYDKWERTLNILESRLTRDMGISERMEVLSFWLDYYKEAGDLERYAERCKDYFEMSKEKTLLEYSQRADTLEAKADVRRAIKEKEKADAIVYVDPLTGIGNRVKMLEDSQKFIAESVVNKTSITIGLIDIDFFKECNDTYGHIEGDECLKKVAKVISDAVGDRGYVYRYGGDEFLVLLTAMKTEDIKDLGHRIKVNLDACRIENKKSPIDPFVTVSQGYTKAIAEEGDTIEYLINLADRVLYNVKRSGRNNYKFMKLSAIIADVD